MQGGSGERCTQGPVWGPAGLSCGGGSVRAQPVPEAQVCCRRDVRFACGPLALVERRPNRLGTQRPLGPRAGVVCDLAEVTGSWMKIDLQPARKGHGQAQLGPQLCFIEHAREK